MYAERHQSYAAYMVRIRSLHIFVVPDVVENASFYRDILAPYLIAVRILPLHQLQAASPHGVRAVRVYAFPPAVFKSDVFTPFYNHLLSLPECNILDKHVFHVFHNDGKIFVSSVSAIDHAVAVVQRLVQRIRVIRDAVSGSVLQPYRHRAGNTGRSELCYFEVCILKFRPYRLVLDCVLRIPAQTLVNLCCGTHLFYLLISFLKLLPHSPVLDRIGRVLLQARVNILCARKQIGNRFPHIFAVDGVPYLLQCLIIGHYSNPPRYSMV